MADVAIRRRRDYRTVDKGTTTVATLAQRTQAVEERTDRLETILASFMEQTDSSIRRLEGIVELLMQEGAETGRRRPETGRRQPKRQPKSERRQRRSERRRPETGRRLPKRQPKSGRRRPKTGKRQPERQPESERRQRKSERRAARDRKATNKRWGELANKMGTVF